MKPSTKSLVTLSSPARSALVLVVGLAACGGLTEGNATQPVGALSLLSASHDGLAPMDSVVQRSAVTGTGSIGTVTLVSFTLQLDLGVDALAIAPDGAPWFTKYGQLLRVASDDSVGVLQMPEGAGLAPAIASDGVGALWMANWMPQQGIGRLDPVTGDLQLFAVPDPLSRPTAVGSDGHGGVWFTGGDRPVVGRVNASNQVFVVAAEDAGPPITVQTGGVVIASDGQLFVSDYAEGRIGRVHGTAFNWTSVGPDAAPSDLAAGDDGTVWFVSLGRPNQVGSVDAHGTLSAYDLPAWPTTLSDKSQATIARAPDGSFWFTLPERAQLGRVDATGELSFIQLAERSLPRGLAFDPAGRLWFTTDTGFARIAF
jgi:streptogramin lyase